MLCLLEAIWVEPQTPHPGAQYPSGPPPVRAHPALRLHRPIKPIRMQTKAPMVKAQAARTLKAVQPRARAARPARRLAAAPAIRAARTRALMLGATLFGDA